MKKSYKYGLLFLALVFLGYNSVYFEKLSERIAEEGTAFNYEAFADSLYYQGMLQNVQATPLPELLSAIQNDAESAFEKYGNRLGIGNSAYFMVKTGGIVSGLDDDAFQMTTGATGEVTVNTKYIFGNALRDASGLVKLTDFKTNAEFNKVSEALNALVRTQVIPPLVTDLQAGDSIDVVGAVKLSKKQLDRPALIITPSQITLQ